MRARILLSVVTCSVAATGLLIACSSDDTSNPLPIADAATDVTIVDSSKPDTNVVDAADAHADAADAHAADAADAADTAVPDAALNGCGAAAFADADYSDPDASRVITFPFINPFTEPDGAPFPDGGVNNYAPKCMTVAVGETVTWQGDFNVHPLGANDNKPNNPIPQSSSYFDGSVDQTDASMSVTFQEAGTFGYQCFSHASMIGAVHVK